MRVKLNAASVNSYILYRENVERGGSRVTARRNFKLQVGKALITPHAVSRLGTPIPHALMHMINNICEVPSLLGNSVPSPGTTILESRSPLCTVLTANRPWTGRPATGATGVANQNVHATFTLSVVTASSWLLFLWCFCFLSFQVKICHNKSAGKINEKNIL